MRGVCLEPGCADVPVYRSRCQRHARKRETQINRAGLTLYSTKRWKITRRHVLFEQPLCQVEDCGAIATDVDHITPLAEGGDPYARANLQALCAIHHGQKTKREQQEVR